MKHFVYLNTDILNSYLSQINDGLLKSIVNEAGDEIKTTKSDEEKPSNSQVGVKAGVKGFFEVKLTENGAVMSSANTLSQTESGRELIEKIIHDNAFEQLKKHLITEKEIIKKEEYILGKYIELNENFIVRDLDYILNIYTDDFIEFMITSSLPADIKNSGNATKINNAKKKIREDQINTKRIFLIAKSMMPFSSFLICGEYLIPLDKKYLRESTSKIRFNYSEKIKVLGRCTSTLKEAVSREGSNITTFDNVYSSIDYSAKEFYMNVLGINGDSKILEPIALYFE